MGGKGCELTVVVFYILSTLSGALKSIHCSRQTFLGLKISICSLALYSGSKVTRLLLETFESKDTSCHVGNHYLYILSISVQYIQVMVVLLFLAIIFDINTLYIIISREGMRKINVNITYLQ